MKYRRKKVLIMYSPRQEMVELPIYVSFNCYDMCLSRGMLVWPKLDELPGF